MVIFADFISKISKNDRAKRILFGIPCRQWKAQGLSTQALSTHRIA